jgi:hypothetical protein
MTTNKRHRRYLRAMGYTHSQTFTDDLVKKAGPRGLDREQFFDAIFGLPELAGERPSHIAMFAESSRRRLTGSPELRVITEKARGGLIRRWWLHKSYPHPLQGLIIADREEKRQMDSLLGGSA